MFVRLFVYLFFVVVVSLFLLHLFTFDLFVDMSNFIDAQGKRMMGKCYEAELNSC